MNWQKLVLQKFYSAEAGFESPPNFYLMSHSFGGLQTLKLLTDYGNTVTSDKDASRTATIKAACFVAPFWDMGAGMRSQLSTMLKLKKFLNLYSEQRFDRDHFMEFSSKWE